jgi:chromosomal replication initiator protein
VIWQKCLDNLKGKLSEQVFHEYISDLKLVEVNEYRALVEVPHRKNLRMITKSFKGLMELAYLEVADRSLDFEFRHPEASISVQKNLSFSQSTSSELHDEFTFESYVVGEKSQFAYSAAVAVAQSPGENKFNPLLIYGGSGLGKTHLIQAIGNLVLEDDPTMQVRYITAEDFKQEFIDSLRNHRIAEFSSYYRNDVDVLLIDDIQFLSGKVEIQNEFFHVFNTLHQGGKQIVLTSDNPPGEVKGLEERLISRFQWGLCVDVQPPDVSTREAILRKKAERNHLDIDEEVIGYLANCIEGNVRQLEGAVSKLILLSTVQKCDVSLELARQVASEIAPPMHRQINTDEIITLVADFYQVEEDRLREGGRGTKEVAQARQVAMYLMKELSSLSLKSVGKRFGDRDHSTVVHAIKTVQKSMKEDSSFGRTVEALKNKLQN